MHRFQKNFLETVLIMIVCLLLILEDWCRSEGKKGLFLVYGKIYHLVDPLQHRDVFSKELLGEFCQLEPFQRS